jgi:hypothetical protein
MADAVLDRDALSRDASRLTAEATKLAAIVTRQDADAAGLFLRAVRERIRRIKAHYKRQRGHVRKALADITRDERADLQPWQTADVQVAAPLLAWQTAERVAADAANKQALVDADVKAKADREAQAAALRMAAASAPSVRVARSLMAQANRVEKAEVLPVVTTVVEAHKVEGISLPTTWVADVLDADALVQAVAKGKAAKQAVIPNQKWLDEQAQACGQDLRIPGVVPRKKTTLSARGL